MDNPLSTEYFEIGGRGELLYLFPCILLFLSVLNFFQVKELKLYYLITDSGYKTPSIAYFLLSQNWIIIRLPLLTQSKRLPQATLLLTCDNQLLCEFECIEENSVLFLFFSQSCHKYSQRGNIIVPVTTPYVLCNIGMRSELFLYFSIINKVICIQ